MTLIYTILYSFFVLKASHSIAIFTADTWRGFGGGGGGGGGGKRGQGSILHINFIEEYDEQGYQ